MHIECECTLLEINKEEFIKLLEKNGAKKLGDYFQKRYVYDFNPKIPDKWIRLRTNGKKTTLTIKKVVDSSIIDGTEELEITVSSFDKTNKILNELGYIRRNYQENKRTSYKLGNVQFDIDSWPMIPDYVEIEGKTKEDVEKTIKKLNLDTNKITTLDVVSIYEQIYNIDIMSIKELKFKE